jgi:hypothetical protein
MPFAPPEVKVFMLRCSSEVEVRSVMAGENCGHVTECRVQGVGYRV